MVSRSKVDEDRFLIRTARAHLGPGDRFEDVLAYCDREQIVLLIIRCETRDYPAVHAIEAAGGRLGDTLLYYSLALGAVAEVPRASKTVSIRSALPEDAEQVESIAREAFKSYLGHYHTDPRLDRARADEGYADWARRSCSYKEVADHVLVAEMDGRLGGFLTLKRNSVEEIEIVLNAVQPEAQGGGIYKALLAEAIRWASHAGAARLIVSTQINNVPPQKAWVKLGFEPLRSLYTFHLWCDAPDKP